MRKNKPRHQKLFSDKFISSKLKSTDEFFKLFIETEKRFPELTEKLKETPHNKHLKEFLLKMNMYEGTLYIEPELLSQIFNVEKIYLELVKINQKAETQPYFKKDCKNCFVKVFVLEYNNEQEKARIGIIYHDSFGSKIAIGIINTYNLYIENGVIKKII